MKYYIAIDGGGTKTEAVLADESRNVLATVTGPATNPNDIGEAESVERVAKTVFELLKKLPNGALLESLHAGISGAGNRPSMASALAKRFPNIGRLTVSSDIQNLLRAGLGEADGACLICGTGSVCFLKQGDMLRRIGGWGFLLDRGGSGYDLGRDALSAVLEAHDGRGCSTLLGELITNKLGGHAWEKLSEIYDGGKPLIASLATCVFEADDMGDMVAGQILDRNVACLAKYIETASKMASEALTVVLGGGIFEHHPSYAERLKRAVEELDATLFLSTRSQLEGALDIAMEA